jgi:hypothetical protein
VASIGTPAARARAPTSAICRPSTASEAVMLSTAS